MKLQPRNNLAPTILIKDNSALQNRLANSRKTLGYKTAYFKETFSDELWQAMENRGLSQSGFADRAQVRKQFLTKIFRGGNCTCDTIVKLADALDYTAQIHLAPNEVKCSWFHFPKDMNIFSHSGVSNFGSSHTWLWQGHFIEVSQKKETQYAAIPAHT
jgi:hypothetical protein